MANCRILLYYWLVAISFLILGALPVLADPACGAYPCITILASPGAHDCDAFTHMDLVNHAHQPAMVTVLLTVYENAKQWTDKRVYNIQANSTLFLGCTGTLTPTVSQRLGWSIQSISWGGPSDVPLGAPAAAPRPPASPQPSPTDGPCPYGFRYIGKLEGREHDVKIRPTIHIGFPLDERYQQASPAGHGNCGDGGPTSILPTQRIPRGIHIIPSGDCFNYGWAVSDPTLNSNNDFSMYLYCSPGSDLFNARTRCRVTVDVCGRPEPPSSPVCSGVHSPVVQKIERGEPFWIEFISAEFAGLGSIPSRDSQGLDPVYRVQFLPEIKTWRATGPASDGVHFAWYQNIDYGYGPGSPHNLDSPYLPCDRTFVIFGADFAFATIPSRNLDSGVAATVWLHEEPIGWMSFEEGYLNGKGSNGRW
jgi:hypothetical protein